MATLGIIVLWRSDAFSTGILLDRGVQEANPFMAMLLDHGVSTFVYTRPLITGLGVVFPVVHAAC